MRKNIKNIDALVKKVIEESLQEKADELTKKVKTKMDEWTPNAPVTLSGVGVTEEDETDDYVMDKIKRECDENPSSESCLKHKKYAGVDGEMGETLYGGQKKLDKNKNGRLDKKDFEMLRGDVEEGFYDTNDYDDLTDYDNDFTDLKDYGERDTAFSRMRRGKGDFEDIDFEEMDEEEVEEGNAFTGALAKTKKGDKFNLGGKSYTDRSNLEEAQKFIQKVYKATMNKEKSVKESLQLTESEMIDLIEKIVMEQKKAKGMAETEKVQNASKKENDAAMKAVAKKMRDYVKDGSKGEYNENPKHFPKGNGELAKMDKMAYVPDDVTQEYIDNFTAGALENIVYDEMHPNEEWVDDNIEGSSRTGNNPEWANAVDNGVNKKRNKIRKDNLLGAVKAMAYNKAPQPVTDDTKSGPVGKFHKNFGKDAGKKATKILNQLESTNEKSEKLISEEFNKINHLMGYNKKTQ